MTEAQRETLIDRLIEGDINTNGGGDDWYLKELLRDGFVGYKNYSDADLIKWAEENSVEIPDA